MSWAQTGVTATARPRFSGNCLIFLDNTSDAMFATGIMKHFDV